MVLLSALQRRGSLVLYSPSLPAALALRCPEGQVLREVFGGEMAAFVLVVVWLVFSFFFKPFWERRFEMTNNFWKVLQPSNSDCLKILKHFS